MSAPFVITRAFAAPRELVWKANTEAGRLQQWSGGHGMKYETLSLYLRPGGALRYKMEPASGEAMYGKWSYLEIEAPEKLVALISFTDPEGHPIHHPMSATWPLLMHSTLFFLEKGGETELRIEWHPHEPNEAEQATFDSAHDGMKQGWTATLDQLAAYLAIAKA